MTQTIRRGLDTITHIITTGSDGTPRSITRALTRSSQTIWLLPWQPKKTVHRSG
jgi:hypothetical protein